MPDDRVEVRGACLRWGGRVSRGQPQLWDAQAGRMLSARRIAYEAAHGPLSADVVVVSTCGDSLCVRLEHLAAIGRSDLMQRMTAAHVAGQRAKTHCPRGHCYDDNNTRITASGARDCRACARERMAAARRKPRVYA